MLAELCLALNVYWEARNQPDVGQRAVVHVVYNRVADPRWPDNVCAVVFQKHQFSWYWDGKSDTPTDAIAWRRARSIVSGVVPYHLDPTRGALYYHSYKVLPYWAEHFEWSVTLGDHYFYMD